MRKHALLPIAVAAVLLALPAGAQAATIQVDITSDNSTDDPFCTLREAITATNQNADVGTPPIDCDHDGGTGPDTITFGPGFVGNPAQALVLGSALPDITGTLAIEAAAGPNCPAAPAPCVEVQGVAGSSVLTFSGAPDSSVRGLAVTNGSTGINVAGASTGFKLAGSWIGVKLDGTSDPNSATGVDFTGGAGSGDIGGTATADRNVFYANPFNLDLGTGDDQLVRGNWFGVLPDGTAGTAAPSTNVLVGVNGEDNTIGADDAGTPATCDGGCNVISRAADDGVVTDPGGSLGLAVKGNFIGLDPGGTQDFGNQTGVKLDNSDGATVGGAMPASRNYVGGNDARGINAEADSEDVTISNNFIGLSAGGAQAVPDNSSGVQVLSSDGDTVVAGNRFGGNGTDPFQALLVGATGADVVGNTFGIGTGGETLGFDQFAIHLGGDDNLIGGEGAGQGNVIGNAPTGIQFASGASGNTIAGNRIGVSAGGANIGGQFGIATTASNAPPSDNIIGGTTVAAENVISNSAADGVEIFQDGADGYQLLRNRGSGNGGVFYDLREVGIGNGFGNTATGPNGGIQAPVVSSARRGKDRVAGTGVPGATVRVYRAEGAVATSPTGLLKFLGEKVVGPAGNWKLNPAGRLKKAWLVSANQTELDGDSSELALAKKARR